MKRSLFLLISVCFFILLFAASFSFVQQLSAKDIMRKVDDKLRGESSYAEMTIEVVRPKWTRTIQLKAWSKGSDYSMILITAPARDAGTVFLKRQNEVWNWVPSIERVIKLPPSMMSQSWMGTDFTNDDLVQESSIIHDYNHFLKGDSVVTNHKCWKIDMIPTENAAVVWSRVTTFVDQKEFIQMRTEFYDEENELINVLNAYDIKSLGGKILPSKMEMIPVEKNGQKTVMVYEKLIFDLNISDDFFTTNNMKKVK